MHESKPHWIIFISLKAFLTIFIAPLIEFLTSEYAITNKRIIVKVGFISRRTLEMNLQKIESIGVDQGILGRILNYGSVAVIGSGGTKELFGNIAAPLEFRKQYQQAVNA